MAKKIPSNFYQEVNVRKLNNVFDSGLPSIGSDDNGKVVKVVENKFALSEDLHTPVVANPETGTASEELENLKIGDTIYSVNKPSFEYIKGIRLTISDGGEYRTDKPKVEFYDDGGNLVTTPTYTSSCDKAYQGNISLNQVCSIATTDAPGIFTYVFDTTMPVTINHLIKLTNAGAFAGDIAKSVKVELTADGENWLELWFDPSIAWSGSSNAYRIIDIKTGEVSNTLLPIVTSADNGKVLSVVNGVWDKANAPTELPAVTSADYEKILQVDSNGNWSAALDRFHVGDEYKIAGNSLHLCPIQHLANKSFQIIFTLPKYIGDDVKWVHFKTGAKCKVIDNKGTVQIPAWGNISDVFTIIPSYSFVTDDSIQLFLNFNSGYGDFTNLTTNDYLIIMASSWVLEFDAVKPTT